MLLLEWVRDAMHARSARRVERVQELWAGYGEVVRVALDGAAVPTVIVKHVAPPAAAGRTLSDLRKRRSYDVEQAFYARYAPRCDESCRVARAFASRREPDAWWLVLEDLDAAGYSARRDPATGVALEACLAWLAGFHARFLDDAGNGLWPEGTYWHLATRLDELAIDPARAHALDAALRGARFQTVLHGDAKEANFCFTPDLRRAAAVDLQYAGRGCGMKDVAYLLHGHRDEERHLDAYFERLRAALPLTVDPVALEREWRTLFPTAQQDFARFLAGWRG